MVNPVSAHRHPEPVPAGPGNEARSRPRLVEAHGHGRRTPAADAADPQGSALDLALGFARGCFFVDIVSNKSDRLN